MSDGTVQRGDADRRELIVAGWALFLALGLGAPAVSADDPPRSSTAPPQVATRGEVTPGPTPIPRAGDSLNIRYVVALRKLGEGSRQAAIDAIVEIELALTGRNATRDVERLTRAEKSLVLRLAELDSESLVPVMMLRHDLVAEYRRRGEPILSMVASDLAVLEAELYASTSAASEARELAGGVVSSLGGDAQKHGALPSARALFDRALALDPASAAALVGLGAQWELLGRYDLATAALSRLRTSHPDDVEGVLRLGVNLVRLKRVDHGIAALRACLRADAPEWIEVVANQELARALADSGKLVEAEQVLRGACRAHPGEASLRIQLAHVLDLARRPMDARGVLAEPAGRRPIDQPSPRLLYCRWPSDALAATRDRLARASEGRLGALARVLTAVVEAGA